VGITVAWKSEGIKEKGIDDNTGKVVIEVDPRYFRPTEVELLLGDPTKAKEKLGWTPKTSFEDLVEEMVSEDLRFFERELLCRKNGFCTPPSIDELGQTKS
jgi:GDPmannose 4,6-dehydratase